MKAILDTNVLLQCIAKNNIYRPIWDAFLEERYNLVISVDILFEYIEMLEQRTSVVVANNISDLIRKSNTTIIVRQWVGR